KNTASGWGDARVCEHGCPQTTKTAYIVTHGTILRALTDEKSALVEGMAHNENIEILEALENGWAKIKTGSNKVGYLRQSEFSEKLQPTDQGCEQGCKFVLISNVDPQTGAVRDGWI